MRYWSVAVEISSPEVQYEPNGFELCTLSADSARFFRMRMHHCNITVAPADITVQISLVASSHGAESTDNSLFDDLLSFMIEVSSLSLRNLKKNFGSPARKRHCMVSFVE